MKKKLIIATAAFCTLILGLLIGTRFTGMLQYYTISTPSNEPTIKQGGLIYTSKLKVPKPYSFIIYTSSYSDSLNISIPGFKEGSHYVHRLCGVPGNIIEMKNGVLYVNNKKFDEGLNLNNQYKITSTEFYLIDQDDINNLYASGGTYMLSRDSAMVTFDSVLINKYKSKINLTPFIISGQSFECFHWNEKNSSWTADNFGPLKIPADSYFVLGDNRHNALDSRYIGFVKKENIKGVALNK